MAFGNSYAAAFGAVNQAAAIQQRADEAEKERELRRQSLALQEQDSAQRLAESRQRMEAAQQAIDDQKRMREAAATVTPQQTTQQVELAGPNEAGQAGVQASAPAWKVGNQVLMDETAAKAAAARANTPAAQMRRMAEVTPDPTKRLELTTKLNAMQKEGELQLVHDIQSGIDPKVAAERYNQIGDRRIDPASMQVQAYEKEYIPGTGPRRTYRVAWKDDTGAEQKRDDTFGEMLAMHPVKDQLKFEMDARKANAEDKELGIKQRQQESLDAYHRGLLGIHGTNAAIHAAQVAGANGRGGKGPGDGLDSAAIKSIGKYIDEQLPPADMSMIDPKKDPAGFAKAQQQDQQRVAAKVMVGRIVANNAAIEGNRDYLNEANVADLAVRVASGKVALKTKEDPERGVSYRYVEQDGRKILIDQVPMQKQAHQQAAQPAAQAPTQPAPALAQPAPANGGAAPRAAGPTYEKWMAAKIAVENIQKQAAAMSPDRREQWLAARLPAAQAEMARNANYPRY